MTIVRECRVFGPTLEFESLPVVGADHARRRFRARVWRSIAVSLALFWTGVVCLIFGVLP